MSSRARAFNLGPKMVKFLLLSLAAMTAETDYSCEKRDGDCEACPGVLSSLSPTATLHLSAQEPLLVASAKRADEVIVAASNLNGSDVLELDDPDRGLHTSLFYFCCHSPAELVRMRGALHRMSWHSIALNYSNVGCNLDMHGKNVTYVHAMPDAAGQQALFSLADRMEQALRTANVTVNHPRRSLFHMTLARVKPSFPASAALEALNRSILGGNGQKGTFGTHKMCSFDFAGLNITADDC